MTDKPKKSEPEIWYIKIYPFMENIGACKHEPSSEFHNGAIKNYFPVVEKSVYDALKLENEELRRALEFYADKKNWGEHGPDLRTWYVIETTDRGAKARAALKGSEK